MNAREYKLMYENSINNPIDFWKNQALMEIDWISPFDQVYDGSHWFTNGKLNISFNCVDRHPFHKVALKSIDENNLVTELTYGELGLKMFEFANFFRQKGLKKGECVTFYLKNSFDSYACLLACARLGIVVNCVFGGFSENVLQDRIKSTNSKMLITNDIIFRNGMSIDLLSRAKRACNGVDILILDSNALQSCNSDIYWNNVSKSNEYVPCVPMDSNDHLFYIFTSGSTGKAKQVIHSIAGYLIQTILNTKYCLQLTRNDTFFSTTDIGWIACLSYTIFGPLSIGATSVVYDCQPFYPKTSRLFDYMELCNATHFNTAPTLIRMMKAKIGNDIPSYASQIAHMSFVGEPLDFESREYLSNVFTNAHINNNYWQTETGSIMLFDNAEKTGVPTFGVCPTIKKYVENGDIGLLMFNKSWPSQAIHIMDGDEDIKYKKYLSIYENHYFTADEASIQNESIFVKGRVDDVFNICGHRIGSCEIENSIAKLPFINESAAICQNDKIMGSVVCIVASCKSISPDIGDQIRQHVAKDLGKFVRIGSIYFVDELPKTRTGKIMRRLMSEILNGEKNVKNIDSCYNVSSLNALFGNRI
jgi:acetyl-CoA synthetase